MRSDPVPAALENALSGMFPEATGLGYRDTAQLVHFSVSNQVSWVGGSSRSGCVITQVPSSVGLYCRGSKVTSWGGLAWVASLHKAPQGHLWAADCSPPTPMPCPYTMTQTQLSLHPLGSPGCRQGPSSEDTSDPAPSHQ